MIKVNVLSEEKSWSNRLRKKEELFNQVCKFFPKKFKFLNKKIYLTLLLSNNKKIRLLNKKFRNKNKQTIKIFIHGFLHLLGYDHIKNKDYKKMLIEEQKIFKSVKKMFN